MYFIFLYILYYFIHVINFLFFLNLILKVLTLGFILKFFNSTSYSYQCLFSLNNCQIESFSRPLAVDQMIFRGAL